MPSGRLPRPRQPPPTPDIAGEHASAATIDELVANLRAALPTTVVGVYAHPSSKIDLLVATLGDPDGTDVAALAQLLESRGERPAADADGVSVLITSTSLLRNWPRRSAVVVVAAPHAPAQLVESGRDRFVTWHVVRDAGRTLHGPPIVSLVVPLPEPQLLDHVADLRARLEAGALDAAAETTAVHELERFDAWQAART